MLEKNYSREIEKKWQERWKEEGTYKFDENDSVKPIYSIDTPPPFTSGELHMGHVLSYSYFDFAARYKRMRGFNVYYPQGWDTQGFPTEVKVEKKYGKLPPVEFRQKCVEWTKEFIARMKQQMNELGFSADWRYEYRTMDPAYHKKVQLSLIQMYNDKLIYRSKYPVFWCTKCVSAIAKAELDDFEKEGVLNYIKFKGPENEDLIIATTRPELLHACVAVMFNPNDKRYLHLDGKKITTPLGKEVIAIPDKEVDMEFGTGLVMLCTFGDKMDVVWMHRYKLPLIEALDQHGRLINAGEFNGLKVEEAKKKIIEKLERDGKVVKKEKIKQVIKVHDRCSTPIELLTSYQWFADIKTTAKRIKDMAYKIRWIPSFGITYLIDWVEGAEWDWVISRQRIFGTPLPFYYCEKCGETAPADIKDLPFYAETAPIKKCKCGEQMKPETSTCDCWVDSSITPLIISGWPDDEKKFKRFYPITLRPQGVEIVRTWAFYTLYRSGVALTGIPPWKEILLNGNVLAPDGKKMSKSLGNVISPAELLNDYPADAIRQWAAMSGAMAKDRPFSYEDLRFAKSFLNKLWNAARFIELNLKDYKKLERHSHQLTLIDKWILQELNKLIQDYTTAFENYDYQKAIYRLHSFFWQEFCDDYLEYVKHRIYGPDSEEKNAAFYTLHTVLETVVKLLAPIAPHISEEIYREVLKNNESIHLSSWPKKIENIEGETTPVEIMRKIISQVRQQKASARLPQNAEIEKGIISGKNEDTDTLIKAGLIEEIKKITKIKELEIKKGEEIKISIVN
ncbi:MAG: valine--tRNA ligase [Candidatus Bilamarchaeaceae archaeon]